MKNQFFFPITLVNNFWFIYRLLDDILSVVSSVFFFFRFLLKFGSNLSATHGDWKDSNVRRGRAHRFPLFSYLLISVYFMNTVHTLKPYAHRFLCLRSVLLAHWIGSHQLYLLFSRAALDRAKYVAIPNISKSLIACTQQQHKQLWIISENFVALKLTQELIMNSICYTNIC